LAQNKNLKNVLAAILKFRKYQNLFHRDLKMPLMTFLFLVAYLFERVMKIDLKQTYLFETIFFFLVF